MLEIVVFMLLYGLGGQVGGVCVLLFYTKGEKMKKLSLILSTLMALTLFSGNAMADNDPIICHIEINYKGQDFGGHDDGVEEAAALHEAKEEACERACRKGGEACELDCMANAVVKNQQCKANPKADQNNPKGDYDCRASIRFNGNNYEGIDNDHHIDKAARDAVEEACESACRGQDKAKKCEHQCRVNAEVLGTECFDQNDKIVRNIGQLPPRPANFHPVKVPEPLVAPAPKPAPEVKQPAADPKPDKKADPKPDKKDDKKDDKKKDDKKVAPKPNPAAAPAPKPDKKDDTKGNKKK